MSSTTKSTHDDLSKHASDIAKDIGDIGHSARQMATERAEQLRETANQYIDQGKLRAREFGETMQNQIQEQPIRSMLVAGAIGFVLGALWIRR